MEIRISVSCRKSLSVISHHTGSIFSTIFPEDTECLFSTQIVCRQINSTRDNAKWAILFQDILDSCETFRGEYGFVIPFVVLNATDVKPKQPYLK